MSSNPERAGLRIPHSGGSKVVRLSTPLDLSVLSSLKAGDEVLLSGRVLTARDQAHRRFVGLLKKGSGLPVDVKGRIIYYCGPTKTRPGAIIGSCGPTTSGRMDEMTVPLLAAGLKGMIGKGRRSQKVRQAVKKYKAVYFLATGGAGALLSKKVRALRRVCFSDLGPEAVAELTVKDFPLIVGIDTRGNDIFK
ncbi:MAG: FumA C-terminus/TtdB family hydratase beta subunit [Candidatus Omnitrophica bacterium]|nr:FumA C-terminus/TtdB family hydratase beta subunit [Candidatus Omnitrophota bacterium]MDD5575102.1 FumA C-terminus/TtdB family hydratase beta subunit [Candidatus Omnitrophota bacterium]